MLDVDTDPPRCAGAWACRCGRSPATSRSSPAGTAKRLRCHRSYFSTRLGQLWARPHQAHLSLKNVEQLRQLVQAGAAQKATHPGDARVVRALIHHLPRSILFLHQLLLFVRVRNHGAEFVHPEQPAVFTDPRRVLKDRAAVVQLDRQGDQPDERQHQRQDRAVTARSKARLVMRWYSSSAGARKSSMGMPANSSTLARCRVSEK